MKNLCWDELVLWSKIDVNPNLQPQIENVNRSYQSLLSLIKSGEKIYGLHTYFGADVTQDACHIDFQDHQRYLLNYLCVGVGKKLKSSIVRRALKLQALKVSFGFSAVHPKTFQKLCILSSRADLPQVPSFGSLGASGDLVPMAHAVSPIFSEEILGPRDVLALVNTNAMMSSFAIDLWCDLEKKIFEYLELFKQLLVKSGIYLDISPFVEHSALRTMYPLLASFAKEFALDIPGQVRLESTQVPYSFRCAPIVLSHIFDQLKEAKRLIFQEAVAVADNPIILAEPQPRAVHSGLFYALGIARASDLLQDIIYRLSEMIDRQVLLFMEPNFNGGLAQNLKFQQFSCKGYHQLISSLMQRIKGLSCSSKQMSFSCESNNQDIVPCGMQHLLLTQELLETFILILDALEKILSFAQKKKLSKI